MDYPTNSKGLPIEYCHIHVPKTGGSWVNDFLNTNFPGSLGYSEHATLSCILPAYWEAWKLGLGPLGAQSPYFGMDYAGWDVDKHGAQMEVQLLVNRNATYKGRYDNSIKFAVCRNPFDWLVSYYHSGNADLPQGERGFDNIVNIHGCRSFDEFVEKFCDPTFRWYHFGLHKFLYYQLLDQNGWFGVKWTLKMEHLKDALDLMLISEGTADYPALQKCWLNFSTDHTKRSHGNTSKNRSKKDYREYYTDKTREMAEERFKLELDIFGYDFEGCTRDEKVVKTEKLGVDIEWFDRAGHGFGNIRPHWVGSAKVKKKYRE